MSARSLFAWRYFAEHTSSSAFAAAVRPPLIVVQDLSNRRHVLVLSRLHNRNIHKEEESCRRLQKLRKKNSSMPVRPEKAERVVKTTVSPMPRSSRKRNRSPT